MEKPIENKTAFFSSQPLFISALITFHLLITLPLAYVLNIWMDEASTLHTTQNGFLYALRNVLADEKQAPLYFLVMSLWRYANGSIFWARLFAIICGAAAIKIFYDLARRTFDEYEAKFISLIFALHPFFIWTSLEIRGYTPVILLSVLLLKFFEAGYLNFSDAAEANRKKARIYFTSLSVVTVYTNYYSGFLLAGCFIALLVLKKWRAAKIYFLQMLVVAALISPLAWIIKNQLADREGGFRAGTSLIEGLKLAWNHSLNYVFPTELSPDSQSSIVSIIRVWLVRFGILAVIFALIKNKFRALDEKVLAFGTISAAIEILLFAAYLALGAEHVALRHYAPLFAPLIIFAALLLVRLVPRRSWIAFALVFAFLIPYSIYKQYPMLAKRGDWARVARYIEQNEKPDQPIIIFQNYDALSLPFYYRGGNRVLPDKNFFAWSPVNNFSSDDALKEQTEFVISQIPADAPEIWLATEDLCQDAETRAACRPLENFVEANYTVLDTKDFYKERVRLLRKK